MSMFVYTHTRVHLRLVCIISSCICAYRLMYTDHHPHPPAPL